MKKLIIIMICCVYQLTFADEIRLPIIEVIDGDTIKTEILLPKPLNDVRIRILNIDTPEKPAASYLETGKLGRANCILEAELALKAKQLVQELVNVSTGYMIVTEYKWDKYGGRINGNVFLIEEKTGAVINVAHELIKLGLAVPYDGGTKTKNWCQL